MGTWGSPGEPFRLVVGASGEEDATCPRYRTASVGHTTCGQADMPYNKETEQ